MRPYVPFWLSMSSPVHFQNADGSVKFELPRKKVDEVMNSMLKGLVERFAQRESVGDEAVFVIKLLE